RRSRGRDRTGREGRRRGRGAQEALGGDSGVFRRDVRAQRRSAARARGLRRLLLRRAEPDALHVEERTGSEMDHGGGDARASILRDRGHRRGRRVRGRPFLVWEAESRADAAAARRRGDRRRETLMFTRMKTWARKTRATTASCSLNRRAVGRDSLEYWKRRRICS